MTLRFVWSTFKPIQLLGALALSTALFSALAQSLPQAEGEVRKIDKTSGKISLKHGEIKNLNMPPMSMVFQVQDPALLNKVQTGDLVFFTADQIQGIYTLISIEPRSKSPAR